MWSNFQNYLNSFEQLRWVVSERLDNTIFLDLHLKIQNKRVVYKIYDKPLNLHMYLPPHSAHPPGVLRGLGFGMIYRIYRLNSEQDEITGSLNTFFNRLINRGYQESFLRPIFQLSVEHQQQQSLSTVQLPTAKEDALIFIHLW